jgi:tetratricopeptide (TPR) repeat protein
MQIDAQEDQFERNLEKARAFFNRAEEVASADNFDYAIDLYLEGLRLCPDALEDGHAPLRRLALIRQAKGGKKPSLLEKAKRLAHKKKPLEQMLNAEYLLAKDPDCLAYAEDMLKAAVAGGYHRTAEWIAQLIFDANRASSKPSLATYLLLKDSYAKMGLYSKAVAACQHALELNPNNDALRDEFKNLCASMTLEEGKYGQKTDFRSSIKNKEFQDRLHSQEQAVKSAEYKQRAVLEARKLVKQDPTVTNILQLAQALADLDTEESWAEMTQLLQTNYEKTRDFTFKRKLGELQIRRLKEQIRQIYQKMQEKPDDEGLRSRFQALTSLLDKTELEHYRECAANYPTDYQVKYEYGRCLLKNHRYDEAIPLFQEAQQNPRLRAAALDKAGVCFLLKGWYEDAIDLFKEALKQCAPQETALAKEITYDLARAYEAAGHTEQALEIYRKLAQTDFNYKDVSQRIDKLRSKRHND